MSAKKKYLEEEADEYFKELAANREIIQSTYQYVTDTITQALQTRDLPKLFSLISYIEDLEDTKAYSFTGRSQRILKYLHIIQLEHNYQCPLFCDGCPDADSVYDKYVSCLFAMRRIAFQLPPESIKDADAFLRVYTLSPFAVYIMTSDDRIDATKEFYQHMLNLYSDLWSETEIQMFIRFTHLGGVTD